jgi:hypothetical protein
VIDLDEMRRRNEERRKRRDAATPGPWRWATGPSEVLCETGIVTDGGNAVFVNCGRGAGDPQPQDFALMVASRTDPAPEDIDALIAEVERLRKLAVQVCYDWDIRKWYVIDRATDRYLLERGGWSDNCRNGWFDSKGEAAEACRAALATIEQEGV